MVSESSQASGGVRRRLRLGMVGGGQGAFIGAVHRLAARMDDRWELVAGAFSSTPEKSKASAPELHVAAERAYGDYAEMARKEKRRKDGIDAVAIVTPNHVHYEAAAAFLKAGIHVICDKPLTTTLKDAKRLADLVAKSGKVFVLTHNYTGYPMVRQARAMVADGMLGRIRVVQVEYPQDWLTTPLEKSGQKQAAWRTDPRQSGPAGSTGDIGTHAYNLGRFITGLLPDQVSCQLKTYEAGRALDDYGTAVLRYQNGALGTVTASQISHGRENDLWIEIDGTKGAIEWHQEEPNKMLVRVNGQPHKVYTRAGGPYLGASASSCSRLPSGHPEAFLEAFANIYTAAYNDMALRATGGKFDGARSIYPNVADGVDGMNFITQCVASSKQNGAWLPLKHERCRS